MTDSIEIWPATLSELQEWQSNAALTIKQIGSLDGKPLYRITEHDRIYVISSGR